MNKDLKNIFNKNELIKARKAFWEQMDAESLRQIKNENLYDFFENNYPRADETATKHDWISFSKGLENNGIEYISKKQQQLENDKDKKTELIKNSDYKLSLTIAASSEKNRFAIVDKDGNCLWNGKEFSNLYENQWDADCDAIKKAIWIAKEIKNANNLNSMVLELKTSNGVFTCQSRLEQKTYFLTTKTLENNIVPVVEQIGNFNKNPAYKFVNENGLDRLVKNINNDEFNNIVNFTIQANTNALICRGGSFFTISNCKQNSSNPNVPNMPDNPNDLIPDIVEPTSYLWLLGIFIPLSILLGLLIYLIIYRIKTKKLK